MALQGYELMPYTFYHESKMLACKGIFVKPSILQMRIAQGGEASNDLRSKAFYGYYTISSGELHAEIYVRYGKYFIAQSIKCCGISTAPVGYRI